jgi:ATP adenylyltransferase
MNALWAPWRIDYLRAPKSRGCFLCRMLKRNRPREDLWLYRGRYCAVVMNRYPYTPGHLMVAPMRHVAQLAQLKPQESAELLKLTQQATEILGRVVRAQGFNVGFNLGEAAGAGLKDHLHQHVVPRWKGDTNCMPVLADTRVMPQALEALWTELYPEFQTLP